LREPDTAQSPEQENHATQIVSTLGAGTDMNQKILFVCTGNYYRSRFAEILFNAVASRHGLPWKADSRGIATDLGTKNIGFISPQVLKKLKALDIPIDVDIRSPIQLEKIDLAGADLVIALDGSEHLPMMKRRFTEWANQILYWNVPDLHLLEAEDALSMIEDNVQMLVHQLRDTTTLSDQREAD